jgi:hypothetical protein
METHQYKPQEEVDKIKRRKIDEMTARFKEHELNPDASYQIALLRGHVITMATQLEEMVEAVTEFYFLRGDPTIVTTNFQLCFFGPEKGLKGKVENLIGIIKTSRPIFANSCPDLLKDLDNFPSIRNIFAHHYTHESNQSEDMIVFHAMKRDKNIEKTKISKIELRKYINEIYKKWIPLRHMMSQVFELLLTDQDKAIDMTTIDEIKSRPDYIGNE